MKHTAGDLRERVELLDFTLTDEGWAWVKYAEVWAGVELTGKTCLFSKIGIGARAAEVLLRHRALTLHQAIRWRGVHLFLSDIIETDRGWLDIKAAAVELVTCVAAADENPHGPKFPGVLTEKYLRHEQGEPMAQVTAAYVLVTPKEVKLHLGGLVEVAGVPYEVLVGHTLDPYKNEYEIVRECDL